MSLNDQNDMLEMTEPQHSTTQQPERDVLFQIQNLNKYFPIKKGVFRRTAGYVRAVDGVDLTIRKGTTLGLVGESGCGKTTFGRNLLRLIEPSNGKIFFNFDGEMRDIRRLSQKDLHTFRQRAQIVFQNPFSSLNPTKNIYDTLSEPLKNFGIKDKEERENRIVALLESVNLRPEYVTRYPHQFSGGQRQRIALARSLTSNPDFLLCDEPVSALDVSVQTQVINLLKTIQQEQDLTMVFITHDLKVVEHMSDEIAVMYLGKLVEQFPADSLGEVVHPYTKALISAIPVADPKYRKKDKPILVGEVPDPSNPPSGCRFHPRCPLRQALIRNGKTDESDRCVQEEPQWEKVANGHFTACHWFEEANENLG